MKNIKRVQSGKQGKIGGHQFEKEYALFLGLDNTHIKGGSKTKVDISNARQYGNISLKNPKGTNTQIFLTTTRSFIRNTHLNKKQEEFVKLFFGTSDDVLFANTCSRNNINYSTLPENSKKRKRIFIESMPKDLTDSFIDFLNENKDDIFDIIFKKGYKDFLGQVDSLAWAFTKDSTESVKIYNLSDIKNIYSHSNWIVSKHNKGNETGTLWCMYHSTKIMHLQMKGSGKGEGYHGMMFHLHSGLFNYINSI